MARKPKKRQRIEPRFEESSSPKKPAVKGESRKGSAGKGGRRKPKSSRAGSARRKKSSRPLLRRLKPLVYWAFVLAIWGGIGTAVLVGYYAAKLPQASDWAIPDRPPNAKIVSVGGRLVANRGVTGGEAMRLADMSPYIPMAAIAIEDRRFKSHFGIDPIGIARAMITNVTAGGLVQGGSTITQQLAKNLFLEPKRDLERKVQEAILALWLEHRFTKDEILELYLNRVYFGSGAYGVDAASRRYFSKSARDVNLSEAALLAGLLKAPSRLSPARDPEAAEERAQVVLAAMADSGFITDREVATALTMEPKKARHYWSGSEHYAADLIMERLERLIGPLTQDVIVDTTIDLDLQQEAGRLVRTTIDSAGNQNVSQGALVSLDGMGAIKALVGGVEYADSQFNRATEAQRQPGSAFKPIVYLTAMETGLSPETVRVDRPVSIGDWSPQNYDQKFRGPVTLSEGLAYSLNTIAAQLVSEVGAKRVAATANRLGIKAGIANNASIALGTSELSLLELTSAYVPLSNGGYRPEPYVIREVRTIDGDVLYRRKSTSAPQVIDPVHVGMMNRMLTRTVEEGTGKKAQVSGWEIAGKTGTSQSFRDALFVGYSANLVTGVWLGNDDGSPTKKLTGGSLPAQIFSKFMTFAHKGVPPASLPGFQAPQQVAIVPTLPARTLGSNNSDGSSTGHNLAEMTRDGRPLVVGQGQGRSPGIPTPAQDIGGQRSESRPRSILELLLGS